ncbi:MAG: zinc ribbon domain-containing protein [Desulfobacteraceae bacterium]|nr:zinc ribbon domain-containing protein [Desulfobacteraceae bacterium]
MSIETKQEFLERILAMPKPSCPHCNKTMQLWEVPPVTFSDGLGWGSPYLYLCFNDECPLYDQGWNDLKENYAQNASVRCLNYPGTDQFECMPVFSSQGAKGQIIDEQIMAEEKMLKEQTKKGFSILANCYVEKDTLTIIRLLTDPCEPVRVRIKAAEMMGDFGELESIEALRCMKTGNQAMQKAIEEAITSIHDRFFTRECPFCAEIIKKRAEICKHCSREVAGK